MSAALDGHDRRDAAEPRTYRINRFYFSDDWDTEVVAEGLTEAEAKAHCNDPETSSETATSPEAVARTAKCGPWFDGFTNTARA